MKKIKLLLVALIAVILLPFSANAADKQPINVHIFRGEGCGYCAAALEFFNSIEGEYGKYFNLVQHEVWNDADNATLMNKVAEYFGETVNGVPYIVIGEKTFNGYASSYDDEIKEKIVEYYNSGSFEDIVEKVKGGASVKEDSNTSTYIVIVVALIGFAALFYFARDTKDEDIEDEIAAEIEEEIKKTEVKEIPAEEEKVEVKKTVKKPAAKKTTTKKTTTTKKPAVKKTTTTKKTSTTKKTTTAKKTTKK